MSFRCPQCGNNSDVVDSRPNSKGVRRRRQCRNCGLRWSTQEIDEHGWVERMALLLGRRIQKSFKPEVSNE